MAGAVRVLPSKTRLHGRRFLRADRVGDRMAGMRPGLPGRAGDAGQFAKYRASRGPDVRGYGCLVIAHVVADRVD
jgi:hypothetical protein